MKALRTQHGLILFFAVALLILTPLFLVALPPLLDLPNHLARCEILARLPHDSALAALYEPRHVLLPDMAMDAIVVPLAKIMPIMAAGRIFCGLVLMSVFSGAFALSATIYRRITWWSFLPALLLFNHIFTFGFLNYLLGIGVMLWALASWIWLRNANPWVRVLVASAFATVLFLCHLVALALLGCAILGWEIGLWLEKPDRRFRTLVQDLAVMASTFVIPFVLLKSSPTKSELARYIGSPPLEKLQDIIKMLRIDPTGVDAIFTYLVFATVLALFALRIIKVEPKLRWSIGLVILAFLALPRAFATTGCVDVRVPIVAGLLLAAGTTVVNWNRTAQIGCSILLLALLLRTTQVTGSWLGAQPIASQLAVDFAKIPDHSVVFAAADTKIWLYEEDSWNPPILHVPLLAGADRPVFFPQIFALPTQHPLAIKADLYGLQSFQATDPKFFVTGHVGDVLNEIRMAIEDPRMLPPSLGEAPGIYVYVLKNADDSLGFLPGAELIVERSRYAIIRLTGLEHTFAVRARYWHLGQVRHSAIAQRAH